MASIENVYIALGSNLHNPLKQIIDAVEVLNGLEDFKVLRQSSCYRSAPMGPQDQPDYINAVIQAETSLTPLTLLNKLQFIETQFGRVRTDQRWGARVLDLDILLYADQVIQSERLTVPHPGMASRAFVLVPLSEISRQLYVPRLGTVERLITQLNVDDVQSLEKL